MEQVIKEITALGNASTKSFAAVGLTYDIHTDSYAFSAADVEDPTKTDEQLLWDGKIEAGYKKWADLEVRGIHT